MISFNIPKRLCALLSTIAVILFFTACLPTNLAPIGSANNFNPTEDELQLWQALRQAEEKVLPSEQVYNDAALEKYLTEIVRKVTPIGYTAVGGEPITVKVRKDPRLNAAAMAHGLIIVHTGLISRAENESQLAGVLAHEVAHVTHRHQVRNQRQIQNKQTAIKVASFIGTLALAVAAVDQSNRGNYANAEAIGDLGQPLLALGLNLTYTAMVSGYSRNIEREADQEAVRMMAQAAYSPQELASMLRHMLTEAPERGRVETFFWGSHPRTSERIETIDKEAIKYSVASTMNKVVFEQKTSSVRLANALWDAHLGRLALAMNQVKRVTAIMPETKRTSLATLWQADLYRAASIGDLNRKNKRQSEQKFAIAEKLYNRVTSLQNPTEQAYGYLGLGELYFAHRDQKANNCQAMAAYQKYLDIQPTAKNIVSIRTRIDELSQTCQ